MHHCYKFLSFFILMVTMALSPGSAKAFFLFDEPATQQTAGTFGKDTVNLEIKSSRPGKQLDPVLGLFPNPTAGPVTLFVNEEQWIGGTASVYNIIGQLILQKPIDQQEISFDISDQRQGIYLVTVRNGGIHKTLRLERKM